MSVDKIPYQVSKLLRKIKVLVRQTDRVQVVRTVGVLFVAFSVLSVASPVETPRRGVSTQEPEVQGVEEDSAGDSSEPRSGEFGLFPSPPEAPVSAQAAYFVDSQTSAVLYKKNADQRLPMASLTKIMTALVVLENYQLDETVAVPELCTHLPPFKVGYAAEQKLNVEELLYAMLVTSASDASCSLSHHFKGNFLALMNQKAEKLGLADTHFENEIGLDGQNGNHLSTAKDLVKLSGEALKNGVFRKIVGTLEWRGLNSTNDLLSTLPGTTGIKTGYTKEAQGCLAVSVERNGREIIGVVLGSEDRFADARTLLDWIFEEHPQP